MALTSGFYNSEGHDRIYDAVQFGSIFDGVIKDGVFEHYGKAFMVREIIPGERNAIDHGADCMVAIQSGRAWFNHTWSYNDADELFELPAPELALDRIDAIVLRIDHLARENTFEYITGIPGDSPAKPAITRKGPDIFDYPIAYIRRKADSSGIEGQYIENAVGTAACPFSTGLIEGITTDDLVRQWKAEWDDFTTEQRSRVLLWFGNLQTVLDGDVAAHLQNEIDNISDQMTVNNTKVYIDYHDGKYGVNTSPERGADTFIPFKKPVVDTYSFKSNARGDLIDLGEDHTYRYLDPMAVYANGVIDGGTNDGVRPKSITYTYHHHTINDTNMDSTSNAPGPYGDEYHANSSGGCFTEQVSYRYTGTVVMRNEGQWGDGSYTNGFYCNRCGTRVGWAGTVWNDSHTSYDEREGGQTSGTHVCAQGVYYVKNCGHNECQRLKAVIEYT